VIGGGGDGTIDDDDSGERESELAGWMPLRGARVDGGEARMLGVHVLAVAHVLQQMEERRVVGHHLTMIGALDFDDLDVEVGALGLPHARVCERRVRHGAVSRASAALEDRLLSVGGLVADAVDDLEAGRVAWSLGVAVKGSSEGELEATTRTRPRPRYSNTVIRYLSLSMERSACGLPL